MVPLASLSVERQRAYWRKRAANVEAMALKEKTDKQRRLEWVNDSKRKDDRPFLYIDRNGRYPIVIVSNGEMYRPDMADMARKKRERENMLERFPLPDVGANLYAAADKRLRNARGVTVFHISNNPLARER